MSAYVQNLFAFNRELPAPFDALSTKKVKVSSKYGDGTESTLSSTVIKALHAICRCRDGSGEGAVGEFDTKTVVEYKSSVGPDIFHLAVYDRKNGQVLASVYNRGTEMVESYTCNSSARDGAAIMMALFPVLMEDSEFNEKFEEYYEHYWDIVVYSDVMYKASDVQNRYGYDPRKLDLSRMERCCRRSP